MEKVALLFAGQGSQYVGMGKDLYAAFPQSKEVFDKADKALGFPITRLCFEGPQEELTKTQNCQPAILTVSVAALEAFKSVVAARPSTTLETSSSPLGYAWDKQVAAYVAGLSLGEYSALVAAGALSFEDALYLVRRRGEFMEEEARKKPGRMLSVIGLDLAAVRQICAKTDTEIANINCPGQIVLSGRIKEIQEAHLKAKEAGAKMVVFLEVSGAFHSSLMAEASLKLSRELEKIMVNNASIPVVCNVSGTPHTSPVEIKDNLIKQVSSSVLWEDSMKFILSKGILNFIEFGPGKVLKGLMRRIDAKAQVVNIEKREDILNLDNVIQ